MKPALCRSILHAILLITVPASAGYASQLSEAARLLLDAEAAHNRSELDTEQKILLQVVAGQPTDEQRATALTRLANLSWRIYLDYEKAEGYLRHAAALSSKRSETALEWARMETRRSSFQEAKAQARKAIGYAENEVESRRGRVALATAVLEEIFEAALEADRFDVRLLDSKRALLEESLTLLQAILRSEPGILDASRAQLMIALLLDRGPAAMEAWKSYFHEWSSTAATPPLGDAASLLDRLLPSWKGPLAAEERYSLVTALAFSRFYPEAALVGAVMTAREPGGELPVPVHDIIRYGRFCRRMEKFCREQLRRQTVGPALSVNQIYDPLWAECAEFWKTLSWAGDPPAFSYVEFLREMDKRFGAEFLVSPKGITWAHRVKEDHVTVEQYGHQTRFRYALVDSFVSTNLLTFLWDTRWGIGGWAINAPTDNQPVVAQVRPATVSGALSSWDLATSGSVRNKEIEEIDRYSSEEDAQCRKNAWAVPLVAHRRLRLKGLDAVLEELRGKGLSGAVLRTAFLQECARAWHGSGILAHEGRHSIDRQLGLQLDLSESEFRAKLSEIVFARRVYLALSPILSPSVTQNQSYDGHRKANVRLLHAIIDWMSKHQVEIQDLEPARPLLPQMYRLTEDQLRRIFKDLDPLAAGHPFPQPPG